MLEKSEVDVVEMWWRLEEVAHDVLKALAGLQSVVAMKAAATRAAFLRGDEIISLLLSANFDKQLLIMLWMQVGVKNNSSGSSSLRVDSLFDLATPSSLPH